MNKDTKKPKLGQLSDEEAKQYLEPESITPSPVSAIGGIPVSPETVGAIAEPMEAVTQSIASEFTSDFDDELVGLIDKERGAALQKRKIELEEKYPILTTGTRMVTPSAIDIATGGITKGMKWGKTAMDMVGRPLIQSMATQKGRNGEIDPAQTTLDTALGAGMIGLPKAISAYGKRTPVKARILGVPKDTIATKAKARGMADHEYLEKITNELDEMGILQSGSPKYDLSTGTFTSPKKEGLKSVMPPSSKEIQKRLSDAIEQEAKVQQGIVKSMSSDQMDFVDPNLVGSSRLGKGSKAYTDPELGDVSIGDMIEELKNTPNINPKIIDKELSSLFGDTLESHIKKKNKELVSVAKHLPSDFKKIVQDLSDRLSLDEYSDGAINSARRQIMEMMDSPQASNPSVKKYLVNIKKKLDDSHYTEYSASLEDLQDLKSRMYGLLYNQKGAKVSMTSDQAKTYDALAKLSRRTLESNAGADYVQSTKRLERLLDAKKGIDPQAYDEYLGSSMADFKPTHAGSTGVASGFLKGAVAKKDRFALGASNMSIQNPAESEYLKNMLGKASATIGTR